MVAKASIIEIYARADAAGRVDIICKNYSNFIGIVDGYTEGLRYMIESEKAYNRKKNHGDLGVRVQTSGIMGLYNVEEKEAVKMMADTDKRRMTNYNFYTEQKWGKASNYTLCLNSSQLGYDRCEKIILDCM